jgi:hypothetical protein
MLRRRASKIIVLVALGGSLAGCGDSNGTGQSESAATTSTTAHTTTTTTTTTTVRPATTTAPAPEPPPPPPVAAPPQPTRIDIRVVDGKPEGGIARPKVEQDERVVLVVQSDAADEVHLHGYDISRDVTAGGTVRLAFVATIRGRFEVELENSGVLIAELTVS